MRNGIRFINSDSYINLWRKSPEVIKKHIVIAFREIGPILVNYMKSNHRFISRTGKLIRSIKYKVFEAENPFIRVGVLNERHKYGHFVHSGTRPHWIVPVKAKALRFVIGGNVIFAKKVLHPGTRPDEFVFNGMRKNKKRIDFALNKNIQGAWKEVGLA